MRRNRLKIIKTNTQSIHFFPYLNTLNTLGKYRTGIHYFTTLFLIYIMTRIFASNINFKKLKNVCSFISLKTIDWILLLLCFVISYNKTFP